ncbi:MerR family transcriptional regulator [Desertibaculum subflavum]|uniref:MerR family transcriptional regulator n=1 Tax=Desertibaculum subflavum TaxID=2268458 RepID=UPI000E66CC5B
MAETYTIAQLANEFGITPRAIRFYEDKNLLAPSRQGLNRIYSRRDRARLALILRGKRLGFRLDDIKEMLDLYDHGDGQIEQMQFTLDRSRDRVAELERQRRDVDDAIRELKDIVKMIERELVARRAAEKAA